MQYYENNKNMTNRNKKFCYNFFTLSPPPPPKQKELYWFIWTRSLIFNFDKFAVIFFYPVYSQI